MLLGYQFYQFVDQKYFDALEKAYKDKSKTLREAKKFAKKYGASTRSFLSVGNNIHGGYRIEGFSFDKPPKDDHLWMNPNKDYSDVWRPKKTAAARAIYAVFEKIPRWDMKELKELCQYEEIFAGDKVYFFSPFHSADRKFAGIRVPLVEKDSLRGTHSKPYKAPPGMKKISVSEYERQMALATLRKTRKK